jgi:hypothetical protein
LINKQIEKKAKKKKNTKAVKGLPIHHEDWHGSPLSLLKKKNVLFFNPDTYQVL